MTTEQQQQSQDQKDNDLFRHYHTGATTIFACQSDPRFSYMLYVPHRIGQSDLSKTRILVAMHGTGRLQSLYRDLFAEFSEYHNVITIAPLFPANILGDGNLSGYKYLKEGDIRYDHLVMDMVEEVSANYGLQPHPFMLFGFSGGGHFAHRFALLHPEKLLAVSVGAPGIVTLADETKPFWLGAGGMAEIFGKEPDLRALKGKAMHFVVGNSDREQWEITLEKGDSRWMEGINDAGIDRPARSTALCASFAQHGADVRLDIVPDAGHDITHIIHKTRQFFSDVLNGCFTPDNVED